MAFQECFGHANQRTVNQLADRKSSSPVRFFDGGDEGGPHRSESLKKIHCRPKSLRVRMHFFLHDLLSVFRGILQKVAVDPGSERKERLMAAVSDGENEKEAVHATRRRN